MKNVELNNRDLFEGTIPRVEGPKKNTKVLTEFLLIRYQVY